MSGIPFKDRLRALAVSNIYLYRFARWAIGLMPSMLPHEPSFHGFSHFGGPDGLFLDIGANDGISAKSYRHVVSVGPILSVEANPRHRPALEKLKSEMADFNFRIVGAGDESARLTLFTPVFRGVEMSNYAAMSKDAVRRNLRTHMRIDDLESKVHFLEDTVEVETIDSLQVDPSIIKIDVEGFEDRVIDGMRETIRRCSPVIMIEYNDLNDERVTSLLSEAGYSRYVYDVKARSFRYIGTAPAPLNIFYLTEHHLSGLPLSE